MRLLVALALVAITAVVGTGAAGAAAEPKPCKLLKADEITAAVDQPAGPPSNELIPSVCQWTLAPTSTRAPGTVNALVERGRQAKKDFALAKEFNADDRERVSGLGRKAFYAPSVGVVYVLEDKSTLFYVQANVYNPDASPVPDLRDALVKLAKRAERRV